MSPGHTSGPVRAGVPQREEQIRQELDRVLASHEFRSSKRSQEFLRYVVEHALSGHGEMLKERTIGIEVFGRPTSYDPSDDATVRVKAGEVRKRLGLNYSDQGAQDPVRIELPSGTYVPEFHALAAAPVEAPAPPPSPAAEVPAPSRNRYAIAVAAAAILVAAPVLWYLTRSPATVLDQFWA